MKIWAHVGRNGKWAVIDEPKEAHQGDVLAGRCCSPSFISRHSTHPLVSNGTRELRFRKRKCLGFGVLSKKQRKQNNRQWKRSVVGSWWTRKPLRWRTLFWIFSKGSLLRFRLLILSFISD